MQPPTLLDLQLEQATLLKKALEALSDMFSTASFDFSAKGCEIQAVDTNGFAVGSLLLCKDLFKEYSCDHGLSIALNLAEVAEVFSCVNNEDNVAIKAEDDFTNTVRFKFKSPGDGDIWSFNFRFVNLEVSIDRGILQVPEEIKESEYQAIIHMSSSKFMRICKKLSTSGDDTDVVISVKKGDEQGVCFFGMGKNGDSSIFCSKTQTVDEPKDVPMQPKEYVFMDIKEKVSLTFDLCYIKSFSKVSTMFDEVTIYLSSEEKIPPVFEYKISGMTCVRYYLIPKRWIPVGGEM